MPFSAHSDRRGRGWGPRQDSGALSGGSKQDAHFFPRRTLTHSSDTAHLFAGRNPPTPSSPSRDSVKPPCGGPAGQCCGRGRRLDSQEKSGCRREGVCGGLCPGLQVSGVPLAGTRRAAGWGSVERMWLLPGKRTWPLGLWPTLCAALRTSTTDSGGRSGGRERGQKCPTRCRGCPSAHPRSQQGLARNSLKVASPDPTGDLHLTILYPGQSGTIP